MTSITDTAAAVTTQTPPRLPRYRSRLAPITEPWQCPTDSAGYEPRHASGCTPSAVTP